MHVWWLVPCLYSHTGIFFTSESNYFLNTAKLQFDLNIFSDHDLSILIQFSIFKYLFYFSRLLIEVIQWIPADSFIICVDCYKFFIFMLANKILLMCILELESICWRFWGHLSHIILLGIILNKVSQKERERYRMTPLMHRT